MKAHNPQPCRTCNGTGWQKYVWGKTGQIKERVCASCKGRGWR